MTRLASRDSFAKFKSKGPEEWVSGTERIAPLFAPTEPARAGGARVIFEPGL